MNANEAANRQLRLAARVQRLRDEHRHAVFAAAAANGIRVERRGAALRFVGPGVDIVTDDLSTIRTESFGRLNR